MESGTETALYRRKNKTAKSDPGNADSGIPFGMLSVCVDGKEVQIQKVSREGFIFRTAEELPGVDTFSLNFYDLNQAAYQNVDLSQGAFRIETAKKKPYWQEYRVFVKDLTYKEEIQKLVLGYGRYIRLKLGRRWRTDPGDDRISGVERRNIQRKPGRTERKMVCRREKNAGSRGASKGRTDAENAEDTGDGSGAGPAGTV